LDKDVLDGKVQLFAVSIW